MPSSYTPPATAVSYPITADKGGTGVANDAASTLTISGNFGTTFTVESASANVVLATNSLEIRNGVSAQTLKIYGTFTDGSSYAAAAFYWQDVNSFRIATQNAGSSGAKNLILTGAQALYFGSNDAYQWTVDNGHLLSTNDNTYDIGASGANRPRNLYVAGAATVAQLNVTDGFTIKGVTSTTTGIGIGQIAGGWLSFTCAGSRVIDLNASALNSASNLPWTGGLHTIGVSGVSFAPSCDGTTFADITSVSTTHTDGTEDDLFSHSMQAGCLNANGASIEMWEIIQTVASATANRDIKKYFAGTTISDTGSFTTVAAATIFIHTKVVRESSTVVRCAVEVTSSTTGITSATYTRITGLTLSNAQVLKTTGIASGTGAASADIVDLIEKTNWSPASPSVT